MYGRISCTHPAHHAKGERGCLHFGGNSNSLLREEFRDQEGILGWLPSSASVSVVVAANAAALERRESSDSVAVLPLYVSARLFIVVDDRRGGLVRLARPGCQLEEQLAISTGRNARRGEGLFSQGWLEGYNYRWSRVVD